MTLSIAGYDAATGMLGAAISSSSIAVASRCAWARAGAGVVLTQNITNPALGPLGLELLAGGATASETLVRLIDAEPYPAYRQLTLLDRMGGVAHHSGARCLGRHAFAQGPNCLAAGNLLAHEGVPEAMVAGFTRAQGQLAERLLAALEAGRAAGGEEGLLHAAGLLVAHELPWPIVDLRVDWTDHDPIAELAALWRRYEPQMQDYLARARNPASAPSYGVPGDQ
jgi:uncharacterized Ntn-hydrolase superfamily protein